MKESAGMRRLCREIFGTENPDELREIARKARAYDRIRGTEHPCNLRGAGRKNCLTEGMADLLITLYQEGKSVQYLAEYFDTSRQTVYRYLESEMRFERDSSLTMRMIFMYREQECTVIDIDFKHKKIYIRNRTKNLLHRAFGVVEQPSWEDFEDFLESRCFPMSRANLKLVLRDIGVDSYDPLQIIEKTEGRMAEDQQWIKILYREEVLKRGVHAVGKGAECQDDRTFLQGKPVKVEE